METFLLLSHMIPFKAFNSRLASVSLLMHLFAAEIALKCVSASTTGCRNKLLCNTLSYTATKRESNPFRSMGCWGHVGFDRQAKASFDTSKQTMNITWQGERVRMSLQLQKEREGGMETEKLSSRLARSRREVSEDLTKNYAERWRQWPWLTEPWWIFPSSGTKTEAEWLVRNTYTCA